MTVPLGKRESKRPGRLRRGALWLCALLPLAIASCGVGGIIAASSGGGGGGGGGDARPRPPSSTANSPTAIPASNFVTFTIRLADPQVRGDDAGRAGGDLDPRVRIQPQYKPTGTSRWFDMTEADVLTSNGTRGLPLGETTFVWNTIVDAPLGGTGNRVDVRVLAEYEPTAGLKRRFVINPTRFELDDLRTGTVLGGDTQPALDGDAIPVDIRMVGNEMFVATFGTGVVEAVDPTGRTRRITGLGPQGTADEGANPGVARLRTLVGLAISPTGLVFTGQSDVIRVTNPTAASIPLGNGAVPAQTIFSLFSDRSSSRGLRIHTPTGALLFADNPSSGTQIFAFNPLPSVAGNEVTIAGVTIPGGATGVIAGGGSSDAENVSAVTADLDTVLWLDVGPDGEIYLIEQGRSRVRVINANDTPLTVGGNDVPAGAIATVVGLGSATGENVSAQASSLGAPVAIAVTPERLLFVADVAVPTVRLANLGATDATFAGVDVAAGNIATVVDDPNDDEEDDGVGSRALEFDLAAPNGLGVDNDRNLLIADGTSVIVVNGSPNQIVAFGKNVIAGRTGLVYDATVRGGAPLTAPRAVQYVAQPATGGGSILFTDDTSVRVLNLNSVPLVFGQVRADPGATAVVAGGALPGSSGDGGSARAAAFDSPSGLASDGPARLFVADTDNHRIRFVNLTDAVPFISQNPEVAFGVSVEPGEVDTVVGGAVGPLVDDGDGNAPLMSELDSPGDVAFGVVNPTTDAAEVLLIADTGNHRVRIVNPGPNDVTVAGVLVAANTIETLVGTGTAGLAADGPGPWAIDSPTTVAVDNLGVVYFAEGGNNLIRMLNTSDSVQTRAGVAIQPGELATLAGTPGTPGRGGDDGLATDAVIDTPRSLFIQTINVVPTILYFADTPQHVVRAINLSEEDRNLGPDASGTRDRIIPTGAIVTVAGGPNDFGVPNLPLFAGDGELPLDTRFASPWGIAVPPTRASPSTAPVPRHLFVADRDNDRLRRVSAPPLD